MPPHGQNPLAPVLIALEARARAANNLAELGFSIANDSYRLIEFRQALVFEGHGNNSRLLTVSGLARPTEDSPYLIWLNRHWPWIQQQLEIASGWLTQPPVSDDIPDGLLAGWQTWWPQGVFGFPITSRSGQALGWCCFLLESPLSSDQLAAVRQLAESWCYCWEMLAGAPGLSWKSRLKKSSTRQRRLAVLALIAFLFCPVRLSALAPAEIIALDAMAVAAPIDGVIKTIHVRPNQSVKAGQPLFSLDDTTLRNRLEIAQKSVAVADAELMAVTQKAFDSLQSKSELTLLSGRAHEKRAELAAVKALLNRIEVLASHDGLVIFGDPDDWLGRPVSTGERIMQLANPDKPGVLIHLPVADAISLEVGAEVKVFLSVMPLFPMTAAITETSYQATLSLDNIASYRLRASFVEGNQDARIGLRGTAKVYGGWAFLGYYLFRRPLATMREVSGW